MARVSRRTNKIAQVQTDEAIKIWNTALYGRLSVMETRDRKDSESLETQMELLSSYIRGKAQFRLTGCYRDNGETGTNFQRPDFMRMMEDVRAGKINCIIVKDLSRFGRDFLETGNFLERILPFLGVRFISVNDNYDSENADSGDILSVALKNLMNDIYAKDISAKVYSALDTKKRKGEFIGNFAAYGYKKSTEDKHKLIIDEEAAPIVRRIFQMKDDGVGINAIARALTAEGIPNPSNHRYRQGVIFTERFAENAPWGTQTVKNILLNPVYLGHMVQGKKITKLHENQPQKRMSPSEWITVENTHPAIIEQTQFDRVQTLLAEKKTEYHDRLGKYDYFGKSENIFKGLVVCGSCGRNMVRYKEVYNKGRNVAYLFICPLHSMHPDECTNSGGLREETLKEIVFDVLRSQMGLLADAEEIIRRVSRSSGLRERRTELAERIAAAEERQRKIKANRMTLFENYISQIVSRTDFEYFTASYDTEEQNLTAELTVMNGKLAALPEHTAKDNKWYAAYGKFRDRKELSRLMLTELIEKIYIDSDKSVRVMLKYQDEMKKLFRLAQEGENADV